MPVAKPGAARDHPETAQAGKGTVEVVDHDLADPEIVADTGIADGDIREGHVPELPDDAVVGIDGIPVAPVQYKKNH